MAKVPLRINRDVKEGMFYEGPVPFPERDSWTDITGRPDYDSGLYPIIKRIDSQQRLLHIEILPKGEVLIGAQTILVTDTRPKVRAIYVQIYSYGECLASLASTMKVVHDFYTSGLVAINKNQTPLPEILGLGFTQNEDPYSVANALEKNNIPAAEDSINKEIIAFIISKFLLNEPVMMKYENFNQCILYICYLLPKLFGLPFRITISEKDRVGYDSDKFDLVLRKNPDKYDIDLDNKVINSTPTEKIIYLDLFTYFINNLSAFQVYINKSARKDIRDALIEKYFPADLSKISFADLPSSDLGKKIGLVIVKEDILKNSPDLAQKVELLLPKLDRGEIKALFDLLMEKRIILSSAIKMGVKSGLNEGDLIYYNYLSGYSIPEYSILQKALRDAFDDLNWEDPHLIQVANAWLERLLQLPAVKISEGARIMSHELYRHLQVRGELDSRITKRYSSQLSLIGISPQTTNNRKSHYSRVIRILSLLAAFMGGVLVIVIWQFLGITLTWEQQLLAAGILVAIPIVIIIAYLLIRKFRRNDWLHRS